MKKLIFRNNKLDDFNGLNDQDEDKGANNQYVGDRRHFKEDKNRTNNNINTSYPKNQPKLKHL